MNGLPYYKAYPRDFFEGTAGMPVELKGIYRLILDLIYMQGGALVDDPRYIAGHLGCAVRTWTTARAKLIETGKIYATDGLVRNYRADKEQLITEYFLDKQRINGSASKKNKHLAEAVAKPKSSHTDTDTDTEAKASVLPAKRATRGSRLNEDWTLPKAWGDWAMAEGWPEAVIRSESDKFKDYYLARAGQQALKANWQRAWQYWMRNCKVHTTAKGTMNERRAFDQATAAVAAGLSQGTITLDHSSRDPFAVRPRRDTGADEYGAIPLFRS